MVYRSCVSSATLYESETRCLRENEMVILRRTQLLFFFFISVELLGGGVTIVDHPLLYFLPLHCNMAMLVAVMLLLSFFV